MLAGSLSGQQSGKLTDKFFPDVEKEFKTPAFNSQWGFTTYSELIAFLEELVADHPHAKLEYIGETQRGRNIPLVILAKPGNQEKIRVWFQGGIHGNEPASSEGMLTVLHEMLTNKNNDY